MKKIGMLNFHYSNCNYGAILQAYALREYLIKEGYDAQIINFRNFSRRPSLILKELHHAFKKRNPFEKFRKEYLGIQTFGFFWGWQLMNIGSNYDAFIVGSDQVWRPQISFLPSYVYFLPFVKKEQLKIAYAVSFGVERWQCKSLRYNRKVKELISEFSSISVREISGIDICKKTFSKNAQLVLDPTLLVGATCFESLIQAIHKKKIVYYKLDMDDRFSSLLDDIRQKLGEEAFNIYYKEYRAENPVYYSIQEWLSYIKSAEFVVTDSFHCVCFCILFKKQFACYLNAERGNTRFDSLFELLSLENRIYNGDNLSFLLNNKIDYDAIENRLVEMRKISVSFLKKALCGVN